MIYQEHDSGIHSFLFIGIKFMAGVKKAVGRVRYGIWICLPEVKVSDRRTQSFDLQDILCLTAKYEFSMGNDKTIFSCLYKLIEANVANSKI